MQLSMTRSFFDAPSLTMSKLFEQYIAPLPLSGYALPYGLGMNAPVPSIDMTTPIMNRHARRCEGRCR